MVKAIVLIEKVARLEMKTKKGQFQEGLMNIILWVIFLGLASLAVYFIVQRLTS